MTNPKDQTIRTETEQERFLDGLEAGRLEESGCSTMDETMARHYSDNTYADFGGSREAYKGSLKTSKWR